MGLSAWCGVRRAMHLEHGARAPPAHDLLSIKGLTDTRDWGHREYEDKMDSRLERNNSQ